MSMDTGAGPVSLLANGVVLSASGGTSGREVDVEVADAYESLNKTISWDSLADSMPLVAEGVGDAYLGQQSVYWTDRILRHCGWYATPPRVGYTGLSVPAMGSMNPEAGTVDTSARTSTGGYPGWDATSWGVGVSDVTSTYIVGGGGYSIKSRGRMELLAMADATVTGANRIEAQNNSSQGLVRMRWSQSTVYLDVRVGGTYSQAVSVARTPGAMYATVEYISDTSVLCIVRSGGSSASQSMTVDSSVTTGGVLRASIVAASVAGGFQIGFPGSTGGLAGWTPTVNMKMRVFNRNSLKVMRATEGADCAELLAAQCEAECATYWIDELGVLQWWDLARLEAEQSVATLSSDDDIAEGGFTWSHDLSQVKSGVLVKWLDPVSTRRWRSSVDFWQGSGQSLQPGEVDVEEWINVPDDEVWISPDLSPSRVGTAAMADFNGGLGSWYGGVTSSSGDTDKWAHLNGSFLTQIERVTDNAFKLTTQWHGSLVAIQKTPDAEVASDMWKRRAGFDLPIMRGRAKYQLLDRDTYGAATGPVTAPEHVIDAGVWIQRADQAAYTADYAATRLTVPQPVLSSVALIPFPGLQLGDVVEVQDTHVSRLTIRGIVVEDSRDIDADMGMSHAVSIRPTFVSRNAVTYEMWGSVVRGSSYGQWGSRQVGDTYADWGNVPLRREDVL
ncbi:hypothetical protein [Brachybacterium sp. FME24]|uniref:hypothetical protein n=1 Tax=Brachybacterium sp. FME24 TaxID=2742605 RepID=UPI001866219B|nr:hypothetical protein [Brachybacterium sp. FME24]